MPGRHDRDKCKGWNEIMGKGWEEGPISHWVGASMRDAYIEAGEQLGIEITTGGERGSYDRMVYQISYGHRGESDYSELGDLARGIHKAGQKTTSN